MLPIRTILHPTDFSEASRYALSLADALASDYGANLVIAHVIAAPLVLPEVLDGRLEEGNPGPEILHLAHVCHADLIVMGSQRRRGLTQCMMGSVAAAVMRAATCPVLIVTSPVGPSEPIPPASVLCCNS